MELPDFMSYSDKFSNRDFLDKVQRIAKRAGSKLVYGSLLLYYTIQSDKVSRTDKAIIIGALGYLISPLDVMPDAIPIVGLADDMAVLVYVLKKVWSLISDEARVNAKNKMKLWFDEDEMQDVDNILNDKEQYTEG
ncbi:YkvA family protein [Prevotella koreensis]|uniref:YkvA family protein n=1 Tax=Prevotella koreensis TaxID=2490854 RepID=UPI0028EEAEFD|nr:YkvA family protein [Prevotella koreensis]